MNSVQLIRAIDRREVLREEVLKELNEMPELEGYRVLIWLAAGPRSHEKGSMELMIFLGHHTPLYHKVLRWIVPSEYYKAIKVKCPPQEVEAHVANGFEEYHEMLDSTRELVECVV